MEGENEEGYKVKIGESESGSRMLIGWMNKSEFSLYSLWEQQTELVLRGNFNSTMEESTCRQLEFYTDVYKLHRGKKLIHENLIPTASVVASTPDGDA